MSQYFLINFQFYKYATTKKSVLGMMTSVFYQKTGGEGGGIKLTYQSPLLDLVKVYALGTIFLQICIYKYMPLHVRIEALPT